LFEIRWFILCLFCSQENATNQDYSLQSLAYRDGETKAAATKTRLKGSQQAASCLMDSGKLMKQIANRDEGKIIAKEVEAYMKETSMLNETRNIRRNLEKETERMKNRCAKVCLDLLLFFDSHICFSHFREVKKSRKEQESLQRTGKNLIVLKKKS
jgi:hypothetical protein